MGIHSQRTDKGFSGRTITKKRHKEQGDFVLKAVQGDKISRVGGFFLKLEDKAQRMRPR